MVLKAVTDETLADHVDVNDLVLVDLWAAWCGPCKMYTPVLEKFSEETGVTVLSLDADTNPQTMIDNQVMSIPTVLVYKDGKLVDKLTGARPLAKLTKDLQIWLDTRVDSGSDAV